MADKSQTIVLIDGYAQIYRSFFAIPGLTNARGEPTNAFYGIARFLFTVDAAFPNDYGAVLLDKGKSEKRTAILPEYKATRAPMPEELRSQIPLIREWLVAAGWPVLMREGVEADDLIAGIVAERCDREVAIFSHDKDLSQLVQPGVSLVQNGKGGSLDMIDGAGVKAKFGVDPVQIPDYLALVGDTVDNIRGLQGVGPKTAAALINETGGIEACLENPERIGSAKLRDKVMTAVDFLRRNLALVTLEKYLPEDWGGTETIRRRPPDWNKLLAMAEEHGLKSLVSTLRKKQDEERNPVLF